MGAPTPEEGTPTHNSIILENFCRKLHKNERIWTVGGGSPVYPLDPPQLNHVKGKSGNKEF